MDKSTNITWHNSTITKLDRQSLNGHKSCVIWFTGLSGSGKSTLANAVDYALHHQQCKSYVLDGDNIRHGLNKDLSFGKEDRQENIRRIGEVAKLFVDSGQIVTTAFISPFREDREMVRKMFPDNEFFEVFVDCPIDICEGRDPKGLYKKARNGEIPNFTGISSPYEAPNQPEITIRTDELSIGQSVEKIITYLKAKKIL
jgi:adenylylsulfate kinase